MFYSFKALVFLGAICSFTMFFSRPLFSGVIGKEKLGQWAVIWLTAASLAFLIPNFWLMLAAIALVALAARRAEPDRIALFCLLMTAVPMIGKHIRVGVFDINRIVQPTPQMIFALLLLLPIFLIGKERPKQKYYAEYAFYGYFALLTVLTLRDSSVFNMLRTGFLFFVAAFLPFYAMSRGPRALEGFHLVIIAFVFPMLALSVLGVFESARTWPLYRHLGDMWNASDTYGHKLYRDGLLRAAGPASQPIVFGTMFQVAIGLVLCLHPSRFRGRHRLMLLGMLTIGLFSTISRGPMVGFAVTLLVYMVLAGGKFRNFGRLALLGLFVLWPLTYTAFGQQLLSFLPFIGDIGTGSISYRQKLFDNSMIVIMRNPLLGSVNYKETPEMLELIQGEGIIDIVNSYLGVALEYGLVGLFLFVSIFVSVLRRIRNAMKVLPDDAAELKQLGAGLIATLCGILVTIATVSSIKFIPLLYWSLAGLGVAYVRLAERRIAAEEPVPAAEMQSLVTPYIR